MPSKTDKVLGQMRRSPSNVRYRDLCKVCDAYFGKATQEGTSHRVYDVGIPGDPPINIQEGKDGKAKKYQVKQVLKAIGQMEAAAAKKAQ